MFEKEAKEYAHEHCCDSCKNLQARYRKVYQDGAEFGYNKANEWHYVKDGDLPRQDGHTCFSINVLANNKKWVYYEYSSGKWFCGNKEVKVIAWKEIVLPKEQENDEE